jgi:hypothetical protein
MHAAVRGGGGLGMGEGAFGGCDRDARVKGDESPAPDAALQHCLV